LSPGAAKTNDKANYTVVALRHISVRSMRLIAFLPTLNPV
jgi:hypothetical protein